MLDSQKFYSFFLQNFFYYYSNDMLNLSFCYGDTHTYVDVVKMWLSMDSRNSDVNETESKWIILKLCKEL